MLYDCGCLKSTIHLDARDLNPIRLVVVGSHVVEEILGKGPFVVCAILRFAQSKTEIVVVNLSDTSSEDNDTLRPESSKSTIHFDPS